MMRHFGQIRFWANVLITAYGIYRVESGQADNETVLIILAVIWTSYDAGVSLTDVARAFLPQLNKIDRE